MNLEYLPEKLFFKEVSENMCLWLIRQESNVLVFSNEEGETSLPVWSCRGRVADFLKNQNGKDNFQLVEFPIPNFEATFVSNTEINEFQLNPTGEGQKVLVLPKKELNEKIEQNINLTPK